jgi:ATP-binding cassette subfamily F protein 3
MVLELKHVRKAYGATRVFDDVNLHIERGDRIALIGPNGAGKSTLMRMLSGVEAPDSGTRTEGHQVAMQYFAQDEAAKLDPTVTVYQTLAGTAPIQMMPHVRTILGGFLFSGDDIEKPVRVLSGGERTRLAVARMLLIPANTLLLDEPTNHLDLDSKDVLLEALEDFGGTLIFVSHDRYFVDKLATKVIDIGGGAATVYPGTYEEFVWSRRQRSVTDSRSMPDSRSISDASKSKVAVATPESRKPVPADRGQRTADGGQRPADGGHRQKPQQSFEQKKRADADARKARREAEARQKRITDLESRIAAAESAIKALEAQMAAAGFYVNRDAAKPILDRHQALMWEVGDLMHKWETLQAETEV